MSQRNKFIKRYDANDPCPVCGTGSKGCDLAENGSQFCRGEPAYPEAWKRVGESKVGGFKIYRPIDATPANPVPTKPARAVNWSAKAVHYHSMLNAQSRADIAALLRVPVESLNLIPMFGTSGGSLSGGPICIIPEVEASGIVVGLMERIPDRDPKSKMITGGNRGVTLASGWDATTDDPLLLVEGGTGTLACAAAGLSVLGRPGADGGVDILIEMAKKLPPTRPILVVGDNDPRVNNKGKWEWPGRDGMRKTAAELAAALPNPILQAIVPNSWGDEKPVKDSRDWLTDVRHGDKPWADRGRELLALLVAAAATALPPDEPPAAAPDNTPPAAADTADKPSKWSVDPDNPHRLARAYLASLSPPDTALRLRFWREEFHEWRDGCYHTVRDADIRARLGAWLEREFRRVYALELKEWKEKADQGGRMPKERPVKSGLVNDVVHALQSLILLPADTAAPSWIDGDGPPASDLVACRNGLVHLTTGRLIPPTAGFFSFTCSPFDYDPAAPAPEAWMRFLAQVWPDDRASIDCLQEWFGYLLTGDNSQQKMLFLLGVSRGGKSTVANVLTQLVGERNVFGTSYGTLANDFGLWPLVDKSIALMGDGRTSGREELDRDAIEKMLKITGGDPVGINRKGKPFVSAVLRTRFVCVSNELPRLYDNSGAMVGRMILLHFARTFRGREDTGLLPRLLGELPGILLWAIDGLKRLRQRGRFVQPHSGEEQLAVLRDASAPVASFVRETCRMGESYRVEKKKLYGVWVEWCKANGRKEPGSLEQFSIKLFSLGAGITAGRERLDGERQYVYRGVRLLSYDEEPEECDARTDFDAASPSVVPGCPGGVPTPAESQPRHQNASNSSVYTPSVLPVPGVPGGKVGTHENGAEVLEPLSQSKPCVSYGELTHPPRTPGTPGTAPDDDLYFTTELDLVAYPHNAAADVLTVGSTTHCRATPSTVITLIAMHDAAPPGPDRDRLAAVLPRLCDYLAARYTPAEIAAAEAQGARPLPDLRPIPT